MNNANLFDLVGSFDNTARLAALRGIAHSAMAKCIGSIRQDIRDRARTVREENAAQTDLDVRNEQDANAVDSVDIEAAEQLGFIKREAPLLTASKLHAIYDYAASEVKTLATTRWDHPLEPKAMLDYMISNSQPLDEYTVKALAEAAETDEATIRTMHELQNAQEREQLTAAAPEILSTFNSIGGFGYEESIDAIDALTQYQFGVKVVESLQKARNQVLTRVMRSRRLTDLASIPLLKDAEKQAAAWVEHYETKHEDAIRDAIENGRTIKTLDDLQPRA